MKSNPNLSPCLLPSGKYMVTQRWTLLTAQDWCLSSLCGRHAQEKSRLQGIGKQEYIRYNMSKLKEQSLSDLAGNALLG